MRVRLLGPVEVEVDGTVRPVRGRRRQALLCLLALHRGRVVSADRLTDVVWGGASATVTSNTLQSHVSQLRQLLGRRDAIVARPPGYVLDLPRGAVDVEVAEDLVERALHCADAGERDRRTQQALELWRGTPLAEVSDLSGLDDQAERITTLWWKAVHASFEARLALGRHAEVIPELTRLARDRPLDERLHTQLILALYRADRQADALAAYRRLSRQLDEDLAVRPGRSLQDLHTAILRQDPRLLAPAPIAARPPTRLGTPVVGRDTDLAVLSAAVDAVAAGTGGAVFLVGEPGIGKTRLAAEVARHAERLDLTVFRGRAAPMMPFRALSEALLSVVRRTGLPGDAALLPYRRTLSRLLPEWRGDDGDEVGDPLVVLAEAVLRLTVTLSRPRGCVVILEDLHDCDAETLAVVDYLVDNAGREPLLVVGTARDEPGPALRLATAAQNRRAAQVRTLGRLADQAVAELAGACLDVPPGDVPRPVLEQLAAAADGIPLHVEELLAALVSDRVLTRDDGGGWALAAPVGRALPVGLRATLTGRVDRLGEDARTVLAAASLLGRRFFAAAAAAAAGIGTTALVEGLREAVAAQLVVPQDDPEWYAFRHALIADALQAGMLPMERARLARRAAQWLSSAVPYDGGEQLAAELWIIAGEQGRAAGQLAAAGRRAAAHGAVSTAGVLLERALSVGGGEPDGELAADLVRVYALAGRIDDAYALAARMGHGAAPVHLHLAQVAAAAGHWRQGRHELAEARRLLGPAPAPQVRARMDAVAAELFFGDPTVAGRRDLAWRLAARALSLARRHGLPDVACSALETMGRCARLDDLQRADVLYEQGLSTAEAHGLATWRLNLLYHLGADHGIRAADPARLVKALDLANRAGAVVTALNIELELGVVRLCRGEYEAAQEATGRGEQTATRLRLTHTALIALGERVMVAAHRGDGGETEELYARFRRSGGEADDFLSAVRGFGLAVHHLLRENFGAALAETRAAAAQESRRPASYLSLVHGLHLLLSVLDGAAGAPECAAIAHTATGQARWNRQFLALAEAVLHGRDGRRADAAEAVERFLALAQPYPLARHLGLRLVAPEAIEHAWGDPASWLRTAEAHFHRAAPAVARSCRAALRRIGVAVPQHRRGSDALPAPARERGITVREYEVLRLLLDSLNNREIGRRLFLSPRTVETHIARLIIKLGAADRAGISASATALAVTKHA